MTIKTNKAKRRSNSQMCRPKNGGRVVGRRTPIIGVSKTVEKVKVPEPEVRHRRY
jgi:hypothetical protein